MSTSTATRTSVAVRAVIALSVLMRRIKAMCSLGMGQLVPQEPRGATQARCGIIVPRLDRPTARCRLDKQREGAMELVAW